MAAQPTQPAGEGMADADDDVCATPKVLNPPDAIWLNYGDIDEDCTHEECADGVTWCAEEIDDSDVRYVRADLHESIIAERDALRQEAAAQAEQNRIGAVREMSLADDRDRLAARCEGLSAVVRLFERAGIGNSTDFYIQAEAFQAASKLRARPPASDATEPLAAGVA